MKRLMLFCLLLSACGRLSNTKDDEDRQMTEIVKRWQADVLDLTMIDYDRGEYCKKKSMVWMVGPMHVPGCFPQQQVIDPGKK